MTLIVAWGIALCALAAVAFSVVGYACLVRRFLPDVRSPEVVGLGVYASLVFLTGTAGGYTFSVQTVLVLLGISAIRAYPKFTEDLRKYSWPRGWDLLWIIFPVLYGVARFFSAGLPHRHSDPLYYHLAAPAYWAARGAITLTETHPSFSQAGLWDSVYGVPMLWFGTNTVDWKIVAQIFAQWMHFFGGQVAAVFVGGSLVRRVAPKVSPGLSLFLAWLATSQASFEWLGGLAKNDTVAMMFLMAALLELIDRRIWVAGLLAGFAYATKVTTAWGILGLFCLLRGRDIFRFALTVAVGAFPLFLRNVFYAKNPLFPAADQLVGPGWISDLWRGHNSSFLGSPRLDWRMLPDWLWSQLFVGAESRVLLLILAGALVWGIGKHGRGLFRQTLCGIPATRWALFVLVPLVCALLMLRPRSDARYANYVAALGVLMGLGLVAQMVFEKRNWRTDRRLLALACLGLLVNIPLDLVVKTVRGYWFAPATRYVEQFHTLWPTLRWIHDTVPKSQKVLFLSEKQLYYLDRPYETVVEMKRWEDELTAIRSADSLFARLSELGYRYVHFDPGAGGFPVAIRPYWAEIEARASRAAYRDHDSLIFDVQKMIERPVLEESSKNPARES